jgi:predicted acylesterase/phospholipase RssA
MYRLFIDDGRDAELTPEVFLRPALREFAQRVLALPRLVASVTCEHLRDPLHHRVMESVSMLSRAMPTGVFDNAAIDDFLSDLFAGPGRTNDFRALPHKLFLVATNLDSGASVVFGGPGFDDVTISRAIEASAALPGLFPPVEIRGEHYVDGALNKTLHASVALEQGINLLLCVNPLVPFDANKANRERPLTMEKLNEGGLPLVLSQTFRAIIHSRMKVGMEKYDTQYPHADIVLFEPEREDAEMFFANIFSYSQRKRLCAAAFVKTRQNIIARAQHLAPVLARHGITLRMDRLTDPRRKVVDAVADPRPLYTSPERSGTVRQTTRDLAHVLAELERWLARPA